MVRMFICKCESLCRGILLDIWTRTGGAVRTHKETNDGRGDGMGKVYVFTAQNETWAIISALMQRILSELCKLRVLGRE